MRAITLATLAWLAVGVRPTLAQSPFHWSGRLAAGKRLEIKGVNGDVHAVGIAAGSQAEVSAAKHARRSPGRFPLDRPPRGRQAAGDQGCEWGYPRRGQHRRQPA